MSDPRHIVGRCERRAGLTGICRGAIIRDGRYHDHCAMCGALSRNPDYAFPPTTAGDLLMEAEFAKPDRVIGGERFPRDD